MWNIIRWNVEPEYTPLSIDMTKNSASNDPKDNLDHSKSKAERPALLGGFTVVNFSNLPETKTVHGKGAIAQSLSPDSSSTSPRSYYTDSQTQDDLKTKQKGRKEKSPVVSEQFRPVTLEKEVANDVSRSEQMTQKVNTSISTSETTQTGGAKKRAQGFIWQTNTPTDISDNNLAGKAEKQLELSPANGRLNSSNDAQNLAVRSENSQPVNSRNSYQLNDEGEALGKHVLVDLSDSSLKSWSVGQRQGQLEGQLKAPSKAESDLQLGGQSVSPIQSFTGNKTASATQESPTSIAHSVEMTQQSLASNANARDILKASDSDAGRTLERSLERSHPLLSLENLRAQVIKIENNEISPANNSLKNSATSLLTNQKCNYRHDFEHVSGTFRTALKINLSEQNILHVPVYRQLKPRTRVDEETDRSLSPRIQSDIPNRVSRRGQQAQAAPLDVQSSQSNSLTFTLKNSRLPDRRYIFGSELAIAAVIASAGIARVKVHSEAIRTAQATADKSLLPLAVSQRTGDRNSEKTLEAITLPRISISCSREIGGKIASFTVPLTIMEVVRSPHSAYLLNGSKRLEQILRIRQENLVDETFEKIPTEEEESAIPGASAKSDWQRSWRELTTGFAASSTGFNMFGFFDFKSAQDLRLVDADAMAIEQGRSHSSSNSCTQNEPDTPPGSSLHIKRPSILIAANQTLVSIAEEYFNDSNIAWLIADLNRLNTRETEIEGKRVIAISSRQSIVLPVWEDIVSFYRSHPDGVIAENIITVVETAEIDRELATMIFDKVLEHKKIRNKSNTPPEPLAQSEASE